MQKDGILNTRGMLKSGDTRKEFKGEDGQNVDGSLIRNDLNA